MKTYQPKAKEVSRAWHLIDVKGKVLGRIATEIAKLLIGKQKIGYSAHMDSGDFVVAVNVKEVVLTGNKSKQKLYRSHSGYPGGFKEVTFAKMSKEKPAEVIRHAVAGMLPDNRLKKDRLARLKIFAGEENPFKDKING